VVDADAIPADHMGLDIGPQTAKRFAAALGEARTVFWNGLMGMFELAPYAEGTRAVARAMTDGDAFTLVGGGDTGAATRALGLTEDAFGYVSAPAAPSLEFVQGKTLPGLAALERSLDTSAWSCCSSGRSDLAAAWQHPGGVEGADPRRHGIGRACAAVGERVQRGEGHRPS